MSCDDCVFRLPEYLDGEANAPGEIDGHVAACPACSASLLALKREASLYARRHPNPEPPPNLWGRVEARLGRRNRAFETFHAGLRRYAPALAAAFIVLAAWTWRTAHPPQTQWIISQAHGQVSVEVQGRAALARPTGASSVLMADGWIRTGDDATARLTGEVGTIDVGPDTRLRLLQSGPQPPPEDDGTGSSASSSPPRPLDGAAPANRRVRFQLSTGNIHAVLRAPAGVFSIETPSGVVKDLGCQFALAVDGGGELHVRVIVGRVSIDYRGRRSYVPEGAQCDGLPWAGPGTPYRADAAPELVRALAEIDFGPRPYSAPPYDAATLRRIALTSARRSRLLGVVLSRARASDLLSLWSLLPRVPPGDRGAVYDRMASLARVPFGITREGIVRLDPEMIEEWLSYL